MSSRLTPGGCLLDSELGQTRFHRLGHTANLVNFFDELAGLGGQTMRAMLHVIGAAKRVDNVGNAGFVSHHQLGVAGNTGREFGGESQRLIESIGM